MAIFLRNITFLAHILHDLCLTVYLLTLLLVAIGNSFNVVVARSQQRVEVAALCSKHSYTSVHHNDCTNNRLPTLVPHHSTHTFMDLEEV